jgi:PAS domain S-box-containing protein
MGESLRDLHLAAIRETLRAGAAALSLEQFMPIVANTAIVAFDATTAWIMLAEHGHLRTVVARGAYASDLDGKAYAPEAGVLRELAGTARHVVLQPEQLDPTDPLTGLFAGSDEMVTLLPLRSGMDLVGILGVTLPPHVAPNLSSLAILAEHAALAIETHRLRRETYDQQQQLAAIFDTIPDAVTTYDAAGHVTRMNAVARDIFGFDTHPDLATTSLRERFQSLSARDGQGHALSEEQWPTLRILRGETITSAAAVDIMAHAATGQDVLLNVTGAPVRDAEGRIMGAVVVTRDVRERRRLERQTQEALNALLAMTEALVQEQHGRDDDGRTMGALWQRLAEMARSVLDAQSVILLAVEEGTHQFRPRATAGLSPEEEQELHAALTGEAWDAWLGDSRLTEALHTGEVVRLDETPLPSTGHILLDGHLLLIAPMIVEGQTLGALMVNGGRSKARASDQQISLVGAVARLAAMAITRVRAEELLATRARQQAALASLGQQVLAGADMDTVMQSTVALVAQALDVEYAKVLELLPDDNALLLRSGVGWRDGLVGQATVGIGTESQAGYTLKHDHPVVTSNLRAESRFRGTALLHDHGVASGMTVVIHGRERPYGVLGAHTVRLRTFTEDDIHFLQSVANVLAEAIEQERAEAEVRRLNANLEITVAQRTAQLEAANRELEAFSHSVSHDLRAPLRSMDGFSRILQEKYAADLPPQAHHYLQLVRESAQRMNALIEALLSLARVGRTTLHRRPVNPETLIAGVLAELQPEQEDRNVDVRVGDLPPCEADPVLLRQVFANLLANALKFTRKREAARIEVGCRDEDAQHVYYVKDNGAGFDMHYAAKLFSPFQRLHSAAEYEGTGIGLATVQRIIQRHGGRIWAEAAVEQGATFFFTLDDPLP